MPPLRILILSDGRPGHFNLAEGIAAAIERRHNATTARFDVRRGRWPGAVLAALTRARMPARTMLQQIYGIEERLLPPSDIVVSAGAETLAANAWLARSRNVPNIFYGSLRLYDPYDFSLILTSYSSNADRPRHALQLKPSRLDPDTLQTGHASESGMPRDVGLLIGGNAGPIRFSPADWSRLLDFVVEMARIHDVRWHAANSRRTPEAISDALVGLAAGPAPAIATFLDVRTAGAGTLPRLLAASSAVLCTADSSSMISECVWARRPILAIAPEDCPFTENELKYRAWINRSGWCAELPIKALTRTATERALSAVSPLSDNPLDGLAALIDARIPSLTKRR